MKPAQAPSGRAARGPGRGGDLILGAVLATVLLIACVAWEITSDATFPEATGAAVPSADLQVEMVD